MLDKAVNWVKDNRTLVLVVGGWVAAAWYMVHLN